MKARGKIRWYYLTAWILFGLSSAVIIGESCVPSNASIKQSFSLASLIADWINSITPSKEAVTITPSKISVAANQYQYTLNDGAKHDLFKTDEAILGATKRFTYKLTFPDTKADIKDNAVRFACVQEPYANSYTPTLSTSAEGGYVNIIPLALGEYRFTLTDASGHVEEFGFNSVERQVPVEIASDLDHLELAVGESTRYPFAMTFGDLTRSDGTVDHYLARYFDRAKTPFTSSDDSVFTVLDGGIIEGKSAGDAELRFGGVKMCDIHVTGEKTPAVASIELSIDKEEFAPLDYDYSYGGQLNVRYFDADHHEINAAEPVYFESDDPLVAFVDNDHLEFDGESYVAKKGGFISGYRKKGSTKARAKLLSNPSIQAEIDITSNEVSPTSVVIKALFKNKEIPTSGGSLSAGDTISFSASFEPKNAANKKLHVDVSDAAKMSVKNNDTGTPTLSFVDGGELSFSVYSLALGEQTKVTYNLSVAAKPTIPDSEMKDFAQFVRKAAGHFSLFLVTGIVGSLAFYWTFFTDKKWGIYADFGLLAGTGFALAGISELIQAIPALNRGSNFTDVLIDTTGFVIAALIIGAIFLIVRAVRAKKARNTEESAS